MCLRQKKEFLKKGPVKLLLFKITDHKLMPLDKGENGITKIVDFNNTSMYQNTYFALSNMLVMSSYVALGFYLLV